MSIAPDHPSSSSASRPSTSTSPKMPHPSTTLIVATTPSLGIGLRGTLPWPTLKADLRFFARVTKRPPPSPQSASGITHQNGANSARGREVKGDGKVVVMNAVLMGRKTWDSLPATVRPLKGRINVVVSRRDRVDGLSGFGSLDGKGGGKAECKGEAGAGDSLCFKCSGIQEGIRLLREQFGRDGDDDNGGGVTTTREVEQERSVSGEGEPQGQSKIKLGRIFVIGGAEIYKSVLANGGPDRILWTRLAKEWECDTYFPSGTIPGGGKDDSGVEGKETEKQEEKTLWVQRSREEMESWVGEEGVGGVRKEGDVEFEVTMWETMKTKAGSEHDPTS